MEFKLSSYYYLIIAFGLLLAGLLLPSKIALVLITGIFMVYGFFKPKHGLYLLLLYVPIRPFLTEVNAGMMLAGDAITFAVLLRVLWDTSRNWKSWFQFKLFEWAFFSFLILGSLVGLKTGSSIGAIVFQLRTFLIMYLLYYIVSRIKVNKEDYAHFAWVTVLASIVVSIHGLIEKLSLRQLLLPEAWSEKVLSTTNAVRIYGLTGNPNSLAIFLGFTIVLVLFLLHHINGKQRKILYASLTLFMGIFLLTYSRGTWIALVIGIAVFIILSKNLKILKPLIITGLLGFLLVYLPTNFGVQAVERWGFEGGGSGGAGSFKNRLKATFDEENVDLMVQSGRIFYIKKGFEVFMDYPVVGTGFATFGDSATLSYGSPIYEEYGIRSEIYGGKNFYSDNQYIQVIAETGVIGVILFAFFLLGMLLIFWKNREKDGNFSYFLIALWISTAAMGMYYNIWELKLFTLYYFLILGAYAVRHKFVDTEK